MSIDTLYSLVAMRRSTRLPTIVTRFWSTTPVRRRDELFRRPPFFAGGMDVNRAETIWLSAGLENDCRVRYPFDAAIS